MTNYRKCPKNMENIPSIIQKKICFNPLCALGIQIWNSNIDLNIVALYLNQFLNFGFGFLMCITTLSPSRIGDCVCFKASSSIKVQKWENLVRKWLWQTLLTWLKASPQGIWGELPLIFNPNLKLTKVSKYFMCRLKYEKSAI